MKRTKAVSLGLWAMEHLRAGLDYEALSGDLLEELGAGRSPGWYWREVSIAVGIGIFRAAREYAFPLVFAAVWSTLYPLWRFIGGGRFVEAAPDRWPALSWPYSTELELAQGVLPAVAFIWLGLLVYLLSRSEGIQTLSPLRLLRCLSSSLTVLLVATVGLLYHLKHPAIDLHCITREGFYFTFHVFAVSIPLALSLSAAIVSVSPERTPS